MGLAMALQLLREGHHLVGLSRQSQPALTEQARASQVPVEQWTVDLSQADSAAARLADWLAQRQPQDYASITLINNAGVLPHIAPVGAIEASDLAWALRVDLEAPMLLCSAFLRATADWTIPRKILNISSGLGRKAMASQTAYCAAKAGLDHFTRCLALEEAARPHGARVCSLAPGVIDTDMQVQLRGAGQSQFPDIGNFIGLKDKGLLSTPQDAAAKVLAYLARPDFGANPVADVRDPA
jgi:benzil reductase ((S)-benzoin forming)